MANLSYYGENIIGSEILKISAKIKSKQGKIYNYTIGDFNPNIYPIPDKLTELIEWNFNILNTNYPSPTGEIGLRETVSSHLKRKHGVDYNPNEILIGAGVRPLIYTIFKTIIDGNNAIIFPVPSWNNNHYTFLHNGNPIIIECTPDNDFFPTIKQIEENIKVSRMICLCSPQNPTGKVINPETLKSICQLIIDENKRRMDVTNDFKPVYLFFDQIYSDLTRVNIQHPLFLVPEIKDYLICVDGISKSLSATGVRVGWMFGPETIIKKAGEIFGHIGAWANKPEQIATSQYLSKNEYVDDFLLKRNTIFGNICDAICNTLQTLKTNGFKVDYKVPDGAIYISIFLDYTNKFKDINQMNDFIIDECNVGIVPFEYFGSKTNNGWFRLSIGNINIKEITEHQLVIENMIKKLDNM
jgi:aspartate aminotransferase